VIVAKLLYCIESVRDTTRRIACITHTNAAADEVDTRLRETCFSDEDIYYEVATIHGFALQNILRPFHQLLPELRQGFTIFTPDMDAYSEKVRELVQRYDQSRYSAGSLERLQVVA
jgi:DNA helicase-2/ATP-dependent DNA helicase PcrA